MPTPTIDMFLTSLEKDRLNNYQNELKRLSDLNSIALKWVAAYKVGLGRFQYGSGTIVVSPVNGQSLGYSGDDMELIQWNISEWQKRADAAKIDFDKLQSEANTFLDELTKRYGDQLNAAIKDYTADFSTPIENAGSNPVENNQEPDKPVNYGLFAVLGIALLLLLSYGRK